jgi:hypothetical protein
VPEAREQQGQRPIAGRSYSELDEAMAMPGRADGPGGDPDARARTDARGRAPGSQDELRRRLADLPASHPSSPRYRGGQPDGDRGEPAAETPGRRRGERRAPGDRDDAAQDGRSPGRREADGGAAAAAARLIRGGQPRAPEQEAKGRGADDALWARAAALHAAAQARRRAPGMAAPSYPSAPSIRPASREPFRPWFTASGEDELWLSAEGTGDPWFADGDGENKR